MTGCAVCDKELVRIATKIERHVANPTHANARWRNYWAVKHNAVVRRSQGHTHITGGKG